MSLLHSRILRLQQQILSRPCGQYEGLLPARHSHTGGCGGRFTRSAQTDGNRQRSQRLLRPCRLHSHQLSARKHDLSRVANRPLAGRRRSPLRISHNEGDLPATARGVRDVRRSLRGKRRNHAKRGGATGDREFYR